MCKLECNILRVRRQKECRFCDDSPIGRDHVVGNFRLKGKERLYTYDYAMYMLISNSVI